MNNLPALTKHQLIILGQKTPAKYIKSRPGRGGKEFSYVEVGYVVNQLNKAFSPLGWSWIITEQHSAAGQVWCKGELVIQLAPDFKVTKSAYGGSEVKKTSDGRAIDVGDDLKSASSDALKKAASLIGIASDIYYPQMDMGFGEMEEVQQESRVVAKSNETATEGEVVREPIEESLVDDEDWLNEPSVPEKKRAALAAKAASPEEIFNAPGNCSNCDNPILEAAVIPYSKRKYGAVLCRDCQKGATPVASA